MRLRASPHTDLELVKFPLDDDDEVALTVKFPVALATPKREAGEEGDVAFVAFSLGRLQSILFAKDRLLVMLL